MNKVDALEARPIVDITLAALLEWAQTTGRAGSDLRTAVGDARANLLLLLRSDTIDGPLINCFNLAFSSGINLYQIETVRRTAAAQPAVSVGAVMVKGTLIQLALAISGQVIAGMTFTSRQDVDRIRPAVNAAFFDMEEELADAMDSMTWIALLKLHSAITQFLTETARPLPRMLNYQFYLTLPSVVLAQRLYADASRADELRDENKIINPAFCLRQGQALSQ